MKIMYIVHDIEYHSPIGLMQVAAMAKQRRHENHLGIILREDVHSKIEAVNPDVVAYSGSTGEHKYYAEFNKELKRKRPEIFTVMGGPHATFFPEILDEAGLDARVVGEGEYAFVELLDRLAEARPVSVLGIKNVCTPAEREATLRPLVQNLDSLPFPDRELFFKNTENGQSPIKHFMTSRGCPYECSYCFNKSFRKMHKGERYTRRHSVDYVINEILDTRAKYPMQYVKFYDDIFAFGVDDWLLEFAGKYKKEVGLPFYCLTRADLMTMEMAKVLKEAGCHTIQMAAESTNDKIRNGILHRNMSGAQIKDAFKICKEAGMSIVTNYILGLPTSTIQDDIDAVYFNIEAGADIPEFPIFQPYPKTELGEMCLRKGWFDGNFGGLHTSYNNRSPLSCFSEEEKDIQANINRLGHLASTCAAEYPYITEMIMRYLIYQKPNDFFADIYSKHKWKEYSTKVYPVSNPLEMREEFEDRALRLETFKRTKEK